ncbi:MAG: GTP cyclohydrolase II [Planktomarina sp.]
MTLLPTAAELRARALTDLRLGLPIAVKGPQTLLVCAAETLTDDRLAALRAAGEVQFALTRRRAETLRAQVYHGDLALIDIPADASAAWCKAVADPTLDMQIPMKGPFKSGRGGDADMIIGALALLKAAQLLPAAIILRVDDVPPGITAVTELPKSFAEFADIAAAHVPLATPAQSRVHVFRPEDGGEEHYGIEIGNPDRSKPVLARLHSACFTGDVLGSLKCDCGPQLHAALEAMAREGAGVLLYLNQEGRGIGLANKMRAYALQDQGFDTVEANHRLGFEDDERDFKIGAQLLKKLGFSSARLMTNNPNKVNRMNAAGISVTERVPLKVGLNPNNENYLATKAKKSGHFL